MGYIAPCGLTQRNKPRMFRAGHRLKTSLYNNAIFTGKRHDIANRPDRSKFCKTLKRALTIVIQRST